jgi:hypothetical protein
LVGARRIQDALALAAIVAVTALMAAVWGDETFWSPDALFYQQRVLEIRGDSAQEARDEVWNGPLAAGFRAGDSSLPQSAQALADPRWIPYSSQFYERRLLVPLTAAAIYPLAGDESLNWVAFIGCFAIGPLAFLLLRQRFSPLVSGLAVVPLILWPPMRWAFMPLTESWGIALACLCLLAAVLALDRGRDWLPLWAGAVVALSFTRDMTVVPVAAAVAVAVIHRSEISYRLAGWGALAALAAPLVYGASLQNSLAYLFSGNRVPADSSWGFILDRYPDAVRSMIDQDIDYLGQSVPRFIEGHSGLLLPLAVLFAAGIGFLLAIPLQRRGDPFFTLARGALLGGVAYVLLAPSMTYWRLELALFPAVAVGLAIWFDLLAHGAQGLPFLRGRRGHRAAGA